MLLKLAFAVISALVLLVVVRFSMLGRESQRMTPVLIGVTGDRLQDCPGTPNCVSSQLGQPGQADPKTMGSFVQPYPFKQSPAEFKAQLLNHLQEMGLSIKEQSDSYVWAEHKSALFGFVDDFEIYFSPKTPGLAHVRSASRVGHSDLGANRKRVEALRARLKSAMGSIQ